ncbi:MAG: hypothetical protein NC299_08790 [Lachnospiraceae bacterium]|nr:hypothetical protein [Lachnospiraceae bacterium]
MNWNQVTLTKAGEALLSGMLNGAKLTFTRVVVGDKAVKEELLPAQTAVFSPILAPALIAGQTETPGKNGTQISIQIRNDGVKETTRMRQIGLFAQSEHSDEVMIGILQNEEGEEIPAYDDFPQFGIFLEVVIGISRTNNIHVIVSPNVYITRSELDAAVKSAGQIRLKVVEERERDPQKPTYGLADEETSEEATLKLKTYTGTAEVTVVVDGTDYDAENVKRSAKGALVGDLIIEED